MKKKKANQKKEESWEKNEWKDEDGEEGKRKSKKLCIYIL